MTPASIVRVCAVADVHVGNHGRFGGPVEASINRRCRLVLLALEDAVLRAVALEASVFVVLGDLFDTDAPAPQILAEVQRIFGLLTKARIPVVLLVGNHDQTSTFAGDHALGPLAAPLAGGGVVVVEQPRTLAFESRDRTNRVELALVPFRADDAATWIAEAVASMPTQAGPRLLCIHAGIRDTKTVAWLRDARDAISADVLANILVDGDYAAALAGNWHDRRLWRVRRAVAGGLHRTLEMFQLGTLAPTGWDNPGLDGYGTLAVWDNETGLRHEELPGPRFVKVTTVAELDLALATAESRGLGGLVHVSWTTEPNLLDSASAMLETLIASKRVMAGEVLASEVAAVAQARDAARAAQAEGSLEEALAAYVAAMPVPDGVDRDAVLALSRKYLSI